MLSPEQFAELVLLVQTTNDADAAQDSDRSSVRRAPRVSYRCRLSISLAEGDWAGAERWVDLIDVSSRGISFTYENLLPVGTAFVLKLEAPSGKFVSIFSSIIHCKPISPQVFQYGAEFTCVVDAKSKIGAEAQEADVKRISTSILN